MFQTFHRLIIVFLVLLAGCHKSKKEVIDCISKFEMKHLENSYAKGFEIYAGLGRYLLKSQGLEFFVGPNSAEDDKCGKAFKISFPVSKVATASSATFDQIKLLGEVEKVAAQSFKRYLYLKEDREKVIEVGQPLKEEMFLKNKIELFFSSSALTKFKSNVANVPVVDYLESHPLGRVEWIKFVSVFFNKYDLARDWFENIEKQYLENISKFSKRVPVLVGQSKDNLFYAPGNESYLAKLIQDAGGEVLYKKGAQASAQTVVMKKEELLSLGEYQVFLPQNNMSLSQLKSSMTPFVVKNAYNHNKKLNENSGNDYWERGVNRPDLLLLDLKKIFFPKKYPEHKLVWYQKL